MLIAIASDHGGFRMKGQLARLLTSMGHTCHDLGPHEGDSVDYPDYAQQVATAVADGLYDRGILICGTGQGMAMSANKVRGIRAALCQDTYSARMSENITTQTFSAWAKGCLVLGSQRRSSRPGWRQSSLKRSATADEWPKSEPWKTGDLGRLGELHRGLLYRTALAGFRPGVFWRSAPGSHMGCFCLLSLSRSMLSID
jgi:hypothetical protein